MPQTRLLVVSLLGDNVILINADKVVFTGKKETDKVYTRYTGYPGGQRFQTPAELRKRNGGVEKFIRHAVKGSPCRSAAKDY